MTLDHKTFDWKVIATFCAVSVSIASLAVSVRGCMTSNASKEVAEESLRLAKKTHTESTSPRVSVKNLTLSRLPNNPQDIPVLSYEVHNDGALTMSDVHSQLNYSIRDVSGGVVGPENIGTGDTTELGGTLVSGDHLDKSYPLLGVPFSEGKRVIVTYTAITGGVLYPQVHINSEFTDTEGRRILSCDEFTYEMFSQKFQRTGVCLAWDVPTSFRNPKKEMIFPAPRPGLRVEGEPTDTP